ncbi:MAG: polynucleotide adenylyltransferase [Peptococcaceae bacterium]|nr:polynucleotide adenylyltransferase [Peptococcaceae bacterium]
MGWWKKKAAEFFSTLNVTIFGAGFRKDGVDITGHPNLISFDGHSVYFFGLREAQAARLLNGITLLNGRTGWLAYILQELFYDEKTGDQLYGEIFDRIESGDIKGPAELSRDSIYRWVEDVAPAVEEIKSRISGRISLEKVPGQVREVLRRLEESGFSAYLAGGVVRDIILGREPRDYDIATSATPDQVRALFPRVAPTGEKHGTVTVLYGGLALETTTLRREGKYSDHRRPDSVEYTDSLREDLSRRDFTINSLAVGLDGNICDFFGGLKDITGGLIRAVGSPEKRFREDALRMIRAIRFACQLGFAIEENTRASIRANRRLITRVSRERIREEFNAILLSREPHRGVDLMRALGLLDFIIPELTGWTGAEVLKHLPARLNVRLAALLSGVGGQGFMAGNGMGGNPFSRQAGRALLAGEIMERLKYDRKTTRSVVVLVREQGIGCNLPEKEKDVKKIIARVGKENLDDLIDLLLAGAKAGGQPGVVSAGENFKRSVNMILEKNDPLRIKDLAINGNDLKALGIRPGREMGSILNRLLEVVLENPEANEKSRLLELARRWRTAYPE